MALCIAVGGTVAGCMGYRPVQHPSPPVAGAVTSTISARHEADLLIRYVRIVSHGVVIERGAVVVRGESTQQTPMEHEIKTLGRALTPLEIIDTPTINAARFLGLADEIGSIEPGKRAGLVLVRGKAAIDVNALNAVQLVIQRGVTRV